MSRGCPAIGSTTGGIPELLEEQMIFQRGQVAKLKQVLDSFLQSDLYESAKRNFNTAKKYQLSMLNERRDKLYLQYRNFVLRGENA